MQIFGGVESVLESQRRNTELYRVDSFGNVRVEHIEILVLTDLEVGCLSKYRIPLWSLPLQNQVALRTVSVKKVNL